MTRGFALFVVEGIFVFLGLRKEAVNTHREVGASCSLFLFV